MIKRAADLFCGAGGMTTGLLRAAAKLGRRVDMLAINHWPVAIETHLTNHPEVRHLCESLDGVDPRKVMNGGRLNDLLASPECTHHSRARGGKPCSDQSRASAWHVVRWAEALGPDHIVIENVKEFREWAPLNRRGRPNKRMKGKIFESFLNALEANGYYVDHRVLNAADYGDATTRERLFIQAWRRRRPTWPEPTHGGNWRPAREVIDWEVRGTSIFQRERPLSPNTMRRIFAGLRKFSGLPFTVGIDQTGANGNYVRSVEAPFGTFVTKNNVGLCEPFIFPVTHHGGDRVKSVNEPLPTVTCAHRGELAMAEPFLIKFHGIHDGRDVERAYAARCHSVKEPLKTIDTSNRIGLVEPFLIGQQSCAAPRAVSKPMPTIAGAGAIALAEPYLIKYYGTGTGRPVTEPLDTITTKDRFGLCQPTVQVDGEEYLVDVLFRMLQPHELSAAMGFDRDYYFAGNKSEKVKQIGNAVSVAVAEAICTNFMEASR